PERIAFVPDNQRDTILLYQGSLNMGRGIELMIEAMPLLPGYQLWIAGGGDVEASLKAQVHRSGLQDRVKFLGKIAPARLPGYTCQARLGLSLEEDLGQNYRYASPNKVYDYIQSHTPVLVSDLPVMRGLVQKWGVGDILPAGARTPGGLAARIRQLCENETRYAGFQAACRKAAAVLCWENEQQKLLALYGLAPSNNDSTSSLS
ncbi:MAG: glycosyltransferase, partial [Bacteroidetes bacterium]